MTDIDFQVALMESGRMNLMHLPPGAISWLWDRPTKQIDAAESLAVAANAHGNPVVDASLLKADQNVLIIKCEGGECFRVYPDGGFSHNEAPMDIGGCSSVLQGMGQSECEMDDNGHQMDVSVSMPPMDMPMVMGESDEFKPYELVTYQADGEVWNTGYDDVKTAILHGRNQMKGGDTMGFQVVTPAKNFLSDSEVHHQEGEIAENVGLSDGSERNPDRAEERFNDGDYDDERSEPELDRQTNYDAPPWRDGDDSYDESIGNDEHMDAEAPESGVASPVGMTNLAGEPTMKESINLNEIGYNPNYDTSQDADAGYDYEQGSGAQPYGDPSDEDEPDYEADGFVVDEPRGGYGASLEQKWLGNYDSYDDAIKAIRRAAGGNYFPSLWFVDDHGGTRAITDAMDESYGDVGGPGASSMGGMGTGTPYVGDMSMDADPEMDNLMSAREIGEATIHMFRNETDDVLEELMKALGLNEMDDWSHQDHMDDMRADAEMDANAGPSARVEMEAYDQSTGQAVPVILDLNWDISPTEMDGPHTFYQDGVDLDGMELAKPVRVNGKVYQRLDDELAALIMAIHTGDDVAPSPQASQALHDLIQDQEGSGHEPPVHKYPDSRGQ